MTVMQKKKIAYLTYTHHLNGSRLKYSGILAQLFNVQRFMIRQGQIPASLREFNPDLIVCHGDWVRHYQIPLELGIPYVLVEHDVTSLRKDLIGSEIKSEREMLTRACGIIFTSEDHQAYLAQKYELPPNIVVHLRPSHNDLTFEPLPKKRGKHLAYAGGILEPNAVKGPYGYRCYGGMFKDFIKAGWKVHVYPNQETEIHREYYTAIGCVMHPALPYKELLKELSQYTAGFQGYNKTGVDPKAFAYAQTCRPNKTWDYLAAGIPTIGVNAGNAASIYTTKGWGIAIEEEHIPNLKKQIGLPVITDAMRQAETIEQDAERVEAFVESLNLRPTEEEIMEPNIVHLIAMRTLSRETGMVYPGGHFEAQPDAAKILLNGKARLFKKHPKFPHESLITEQEAKELQVHFEKPRRYATKVVGPEETKEQTHEAA